MAPSNWLRAPATGRSLAHTQAATSPDGAPDPEAIWAQLRQVYDPEIPVNIVDLGLVYGADVDEHSNTVLSMTLTSAACPLTDVIEDQTRAALDGIVNDFRIEWVWMPPWGPDKITDDGREMLRALGFNVG